MTAASIFGFIYSAIKAIPILNSWYRKFSVWYIQQERERLHEEDRKAMGRMFGPDQDQRDLEKQIGSASPGELSGLPSELRDTLPNVGMPPKS